MDFASDLFKKSQSNAPSEAQPNNPDEPSNADLFSSAKVVAGAAQSQFRNEDYDKSKAADASADLLGAAKEYGKLDDSQGIGQYVDKAEGYLRQYNSSAQTGAAGGDSVGSEIPKSDDPEEAVDSDSLKPAAGGGASAIGEKIGISGGEEPSDGVGEYVKKAEGLLDKPSGDGGEEGYLEKAEEVVKKPLSGSEDAEEGYLSKLASGGGEEDKAEEAPSGGGGGFGNVMKSAGGFLNK